jgi:hypothetical protein
MVNCIFAKLAVSNLEAHGLGTFSGFDQFDFWQPGEINRWPNLPHTKSKAINKNNIII